jgi:septal ring factor EnvC (AmiA/AmiB activator)
VVVLLTVTGYAVTITQEKANTETALVALGLRESEAREAAERASKAEKVAEEKRRDAEMAQGEQEALKVQFQVDLRDLQQRIADARGDAEKLKRIASEVAAKRGDAGTAATAPPIKVRSVDSHIGDPP